MRSRLLVIAFAIGLTFALGGAAAWPVSASQPTPPTVRNQQPCPQPGPFNGATPARPFQPGDPTCDARQFGRIRPGFIKQPALSRPSGATAQAVSQFNVAVASGGNAGIGGMYALRGVTQPTNIGSGDTVYTTMHAGGGGIDWIEIGWRIFGWSPTPVIFVATRTAFSEFPQYPISGGMNINLELFQYNDFWWAAYLYWNGTWQLLYLGYVGSAWTPDPNVVVEVFTEPANPLILPATWTQNAQVFKCTTISPPAGCAWRTWDQAVAGSYFLADPPYHGYLYSFALWYAYGP